MVYHSNRTTDLGGCIVVGSNLPQVCHPFAMRTAALLLVLAPMAQAQWNPSVGEWGKSEQTDIRVATWNVKDALCRTANKSEAAYNWAAAARTMASRAKFSGMSVPKSKDHTEV